MYTYIYMCVCVLCCHSHRHADKVAESVVLILDDEGGVVLSLGLPPDDDRCGTDGMGCVGVWKSQGSENDGRSLSHTHTHTCMDRQTEGEKERERHTQRTTKEACKKRGTQTGGNMDPQTSIAWTE